MNKYDYDYQEALCKEVDDLRKENEQLKQKMGKVSSLKKELEESARINREHGCEDAAREYEEFISQLD